MNTNPGGVPTLLLLLLLLLWMTYSKQLLYSGVEIQTTKVVGNKLVKVLFINIFIYSTLLHQLKVTASLLTSLLQLH